MDVFMAIIGGGFDIVWRTFSDMAAVMFCPAVRPSLGFSLLVLVSLAAFLGGGFLAASIAESKERNRLLHFCCGLLLPYAYAVILRRMPTALRPVAEQEEEPEPAAVVPPPPEQAEGEPAKLRINYEFQKMKTWEEKKEEAPEPQPEPAAPAEEEGLVEANQEYFSSIKMDSEGNYNGPFVIELDDGRIVEANRIVEAHPAFVEFEALGQGDKLSVMRIPYSKVSGVMLKSDWIENQK